MQWWARWWAEDDFFSSERKNPKQINYLGLATWRRGWSASGTIGTNQANVTAELTGEAAMIASTSDRAWWGPSRARPFWAAQRRFHVRACFGWDARDVESERKCEPPPELQRYNVHQAFNERAPNGHQI